MPNNQKLKSKSGFVGLAVATLGVVYGDIGTSPLYAIRECFSGVHGAPITQENILGVLSLVFWALILIISIKYMIFVLRADNNGEGGILALMALCTPKNLLSRTPVILIGIFGACLLYADGIITPAISVLSAVEGLKVATPIFDNYILPISIGVLVAIFSVQRFGSGAIGFVSGPIMLVWYFTLAALGLGHIFQNTHVLASFNPIHGFDFIAQNPGVGFVVLGSVFLVVTGGEALYADMGHFGKLPIRVMWFFVALPALFLNYLGQGALLLNDPGSIEHPFFMLAPDWFRFPLVILATLATVIASQAVISGVFSLSRQAVQLGYFPRLKVVHTSESEIGQIYVPFMNALLFIATVLVVLMFKTSSELAGAYGIAISLTMLITSMLVTIAGRRIWHWSRLTTALIGAFLLTVDIPFFAANLFKLDDGGWLPILIATLMFLLMATWKRGRQILAERLIEKSQPIKQFLEYLKNTKPAVVPGTAIFMTGDPVGTPLALISNVKHNKVIHSQIITLCIRTEQIPYVDLDKRIAIEELTKGFYKVNVHYGFKETPNILKIMKFLESRGLAIDMDDATFFLGRETLIPSKYPGMAIWRERLFSLMSKNSERATQFFNLPPEKVIEVGIQVEI